MAEEKSAGRPLGATGATVRKNIRRIRDDLGVSAPELSSRLERHGRPIPPLGINRIESGQRRIDVDDLMAICAALSVSPAMLLMPAMNDDDSEVQEKDLVSITGWHKPISARPVWEYLSGAKPLVQGTLSSFAKFWPSWVREQFEKMMAEVAAGMADQLKLQGSSDGDD